MQQTFLKGTVTILTLLLLTALALGQASVPNLINFQGRLTDASGNPVTDGVHAVTFRLFDVPSGGAALWTEAATPTTSGGLFTHLLGSITALLQTIFQNYDSLYLEITADGVTISPRNRLSSVAYSRVANILETRDDNSDTVTLRTNSLGVIFIYEDIDGQERVALGDGTGGELRLYDESVPSNITAQLDANISTGGTLALNQEDGTSGVTLNGGSTANGSTLFMRNAAGASTISLDADLTGTTAAVLPSGSISDLEIFDEPGVASNNADGGVSSINLSAAVQTLLSRSLTAPSTGYVLVIGTVGVRINHTTGASSFAELGISDAAGTFPATQDDLLLDVSLNAASGFYRHIVTVQGLFSVSAGASTFYLLGHETQGDYTVFDRQLSLIFFPTAYGTVTSTLAAAGSNPRDEVGMKIFGLTAPEIAAEQAEAEAFNQARIEKELFEIQTQRVALEERIKKLEEQISQESEVEK